MNFQLIIPMSGVGDRFRKAGYETLKPLIKVEGKTIISHVIDMYPGISNVTFICNEEHLRDKTLDLENHLRMISSESKIIGIAPHKKGPVHAVLKSFDYIDRKMPTIVNYCDFNCIWDLEAFNKHINTSNCDGCVVGYTGFHPHMLHNTNYAYVKKDKDLVIDIQEKLPFSNNPMDEFASSGTYYFRTGGLMEKYFKEVVSQDLSVKDEYYVSMSYKPMLEDKLKVNTFQVKHFMQWGTPEDLFEFKWYSELFRNHNKINQENNKEKLLTLPGTLLMPIAGLGSRFKREVYEKPKPLINVSNKPMLIQALNKLPSYENINIILRNNMDYKDECLMHLKSEYPNAVITEINNSTEGQASTCLLGIEESNRELPLTISACDHGIKYSQKLFNITSQGDDADIVIWVSSGHPGTMRNPNMYGWVEEDKGQVISVSVKKPLGNPSKDKFIIGTFTFKKIEYFVKAAEKMIKEGDRVNGEYYVDTCINHAIELGLKVVIFEVDSYSCWGTPDELNTYNYWQDCFDLWDKHVYAKTQDLDYKS